MTRRLVPGSCVPGPRLAVPDQVAQFPGSASAARTRGGPARASSSADPGAHRATSVLRPGTCLMCRALSTTTSTASSSIEYGHIPVHARPLHPHLRDPVRDPNQSRRISRAGRGRAERLGSARRACPHRSIRTHAVSCALCTSSPQQQAIIVSTAISLLTNTTGQAAARGRLSGTDDSARRAQLALATVRGAEQPPRHTESRATRHQVVADVTASNGPPSFSSFAGARPNPRTQPCRPPRRPGMATESKIASRGAGAFGPGGLRERVVRG